MPVEAWRRGRRRVSVVPGGTAYSHEGCFPSTSRTDVLWYSSCWRYFSCQFEVSSRAAEKTVAATARSTPRLRGTRSARSNEGGDGCPYTRRYVGSRQLRYCGKRGGSRCTTSRWSRPHRTSPGVREWIPSHLPVYARFAAELTLAAVMQTSRPHTRITAAPRAVEPRERRPRRRLRPRAPRPRAADLRRARARLPRAALPRLRRDHVAHLGQRPGGRRLRPLGRRSHRARLAPLRRLHLLVRSDRPPPARRPLRRVGGEPRRGRGPRRRARHGASSRPPTASRDSAWPCFPRCWPLRSSRPSRSRAVAALRSSTSCCPTRSRRRSRPAHARAARRAELVRRRVRGRGCSRSPASLLGLVAVTRPEAALAPAAATLVWLALRAWAVSERRVRAVLDGARIALPAAVVSVARLCAVPVRRRPAHARLEEPLPGRSSARRREHRHLEHARPSHCEAPSCSPASARSTR